MKPAPTTQVLFGALSFLVFQLALSCPAFAQAWLPPKGSMDVGFSYQYVFALDHISSAPFGDPNAGKKLGSPVYSQTMAVDLDLGLSDKMAVTFTVPYVTSKFPGGIDIGHRRARRTLALTNRQDDGTYNGAVQDLRFGVRYSLPMRRLAITPFVEGIVPSHHYETNAHAAIGRDLRGVTAGVNVGRFFGPYVYFQTRYSYTAAESVVGIRPNRSRVEGEVGYFLTDRVALRAAVTFLATHYDEDSPAAKAWVANVTQRADLDLLVRNSVHHDRIMKERHLHLGGGLSYALGRSWAIHASALGFVWGQYGHAANAITVGINRRFTFGGSAGQPVAATSRTDRVHDGPARDDAPTARPLKSGPGAKVGTARP